MPWPPLAAVAILAPAPAAAQAVIKVNDNVNFKFGFQFQGWADWQQSATTGGTAQNLFVRRARLLVGGQVAKDVTFFFQTDSGNLGKVNPATGVKQTNTGFVIQDAWISWKLNDAFILDAGHFLVPLSRNILQSTLSFFTLDISPTSTVMAGPTQTNGLRDNGFQAKGYLVDGGRLEYRAAVMQGVRDSASQNSFRTAGYLQYNFFETERGYVFAGTNLGKKKVLNVNGGVDVQKDYKAYSGDVFATIPVAKGDEVGGQVQWIHYDGGDFLKTIPEQDDVLVEAAYYLSKVEGPALPQVREPEVRQRRRQVEGPGQVRRRAQLVRLRAELQDHGPVPPRRPEERGAQSRRTSSRSSSRASTSEPSGRRRGDDPPGAVLRRPPRRASNADRRGSPRSPADRKRDFRGRPPVRPRADRRPRARPRPADRPDRLRVRRELLPADPEGRRPRADRRRGRRRSSDSPARRRSR